MYEKMKHTKLKISKKKMRNLLKLALFLQKMSKDIEFNMTHYRADLSQPRDIHTCGTAACAAGWGPAAGIGKRKNLTSDWATYIQTYLLDSDSSAAYYWLFCSSWKYVDNTAEGAAKRILYTLVHGVPENWRQQMGQDGGLTLAPPLCYV